MRSGAMVLLGAIVLAASGDGQAPPAAAASADVAISGTVRDKTTGAPLKDYTISTYVGATWANGGISMPQGTKAVTTKTDAAGHYRLGGLPAAVYHVDCQGPKDPFGGELMRIVTVGASDVENIDFSAVLPGSITGRVLDENKEPVPNMSVELVSKEYFLGTAGYYRKGGAQTNDLGEFRIASVEPGHAFYLMTEMRRGISSAHAVTPLNPRMRRRVPVRTWYPSSPDREGAAAITLRPGEQREAIDIEVKKTPSYCFSGVAMTPNGPAALNVWIEMFAPSSGISGSGGSFMAQAGAVTGADGQFRLCDYYPGVYRVTVSERNGTPDSTAGFFTVTISDKDIEGLRLPTSPRTSMEADVELEGPAPRTPVAVKTQVGLRPMFRTQMPGERSAARIEIPGTAELSGLMPDEYAVRATVNSPGLYVKDVTYGGRSVLYEALQAGSTAAGTPLRVVIAQDGGRVMANVADKDGNPIGNATVILMPEGTASEGILAARLISGKTTQDGRFQSDTVAPGKYFMVATEDPYNMTPESIGTLWQSHNRYREVELEPGGSATVNLEPVSIR